MQKLLGWLDKYLLEFLIAFLLVFIPLYPKFPLIDVKQTWVYIRLEDFLVALVVGIWLIQLGRKKVSLKTPLTIPIFIYWLVGGISLLHAIFILRSQMLYFSPHLGVLHYLRRIEYMILFFVAASTVGDLRVIKKYLWAIALAVFGVCFYGLGQRLLGFPAFLTMNEEFAKGLPLYLPPTARLTSTFAGHYDLAAWLVLMICLLGSLIFAFQKRSIKFLFFLLAFLSLILLLLSASRVSFIVYLVSISLVLAFHKKKWLILPVVLGSIFMMNIVSGASARFIKTLRVEKIVYDVATGQPIATLEKESDIGKIITEEEEIAKEELPLGSGFIRLPLLEKTPEATQVAVIKRPIFTDLKVATKASEVATVSGEFLIKRAIVYDISFTTRFQGEWPRALEAFRRNIFLGSGFSSISLATDNDYLRALGETGIFGLTSFLAILAIFGLLVRQGLRKIELSLPRSLLIGILAGLFGLMLNAVLIDVFEASKVAYSLWMILGLGVGTIQISVPKRRSLFKEAGEIAAMPITAIVVLVFAAFLLFGTAFKNYFVGDDFTWLRWAANAKIEDIPQFFLAAQGFFYRPLAKLYFWLVNPVFGLQPQGYHLVSLLLHLGCAVGGYFLVLLLERKKLVALLTAILFLIHPFNGETVFWISSTSALLASFFYLWGFIAYLVWRRKGDKLGRGFFLLAILAFILGLISHERAVTFPVIIIFYDFVFGYWRKTKTKFGRIVSYLPFFFLLGFYLWLRNNIAQAHGLSGDYSYHWINLPFNFGGNILGYLGGLVGGYRFISFYDWLRLFLRTRKILAFVLLVGGVVSGLKIWRRIKLSQVAFFAIGWFIILLLPFLGFGNIAERHIYPAHLGFFIGVGLFIDYLYCWLVKKNLKIAILIIILLVVMIDRFYLLELKKTERDWYQAGEISNRVLLALGSNYKNFPPDCSLYFVNLPIRHNRAWVFPVGLKDGIWFIYRDESLRIYQTNNIEETLNFVEEKPNTYVFLYENDELKEAKR